MAVAPLLALLFCFTSAASFPPTISLNLADSHLLKDVVQAVADRQRWGGAGEVRVLDLRLRKARRRRYRRFEFGVRAGEGVWTARFWDEVSPWRRLKKGVFAGAGSRAVLDEFTVVGPAEIKVRNDEEAFSLHCPLNFTVSKVKKILLSEGIAVKVQGAVEIFLDDLSSMYSRVNASSLRIFSRLYPLLFSSHSCEHLFPVQFSGSPSLVAFKLSNPLARVKAITLSKDAVYLYRKKSHRKQFFTTQRHPIDFLDKSIVLVESLLRSSVGVETFKDQVPTISSVKVAAVNLVKFELEIIRGIDDDDAYLKSLDEWRTKPDVEHVWYNVVAKVETDLLKPLLLKKLRPFVAADSIAWSTLTSNLSYTQLPSAIGASDGLTLDLKW